MDPLFERRQLVKQVHIPSQYVQRNIQSALLAQLKLRYEGKCLFEGYIQPNSVSIVEYSLGRVNMVRGGVEYMVTFQCDICMPHAGQILQANTVLISKVGVHAEVAPVKVLLPRDLHIGHEEFQSIQVGQPLTCVVVGSQYRQHDKDIIVVATLQSLPKQAAPLPLLSSVAPVATPTESAGVATESDEKLVTVTPSQPEKPKRKLKRATPVATNESAKEGMVEGPIGEA